MFQFSQKAQADAQEVQDLTEEQLLQIAGGVAQHKTTPTNNGKHAAKGHSKTHSKGKATGHHHK